MTPCRAALGCGWPCIANGRDRRPAGNGGGRRRRSNRPGNSQANGPRARALWRAGAARRGRQRPRGGGRKLSGPVQRGQDRAGRRGAPKPRRGPCPVSEPKRTPLYDLHRELGGRMVAVRRLGAAGPVPGRHPGRAPALPRRRRPVRRLAHGPGPPRRCGRRRSPGAPGARRHPGARGRPRALHPAHRRRTAASSTT